MFFGFGHIHVRERAADLKTCASLHDDSGRPTRYFSKMSCCCPFLQHGRREEGKGEQEQQRSENRQQQETPPQRQQGQIEKATSSSYESSRLPPPRATTAMTTMWPVHVHSIVHDFVTSAVFYLQLELVAHAKWKVWTRNCFGQQAKWLGFFELETAVVAGLLVWCPKPIKCWKCML